jgi:hypothetical protein
MAEGLDPNERYDKEVQLMAKHFNFDLDIVQECFEQSLYPNLLSEKQYSAFRKDLKNLKLFKKAIQRGLDTYGLYSEELRALDKLEGKDPERDLKMILTDTVALESGLNNIAKRNSRAKGKNLEAQVIANWLAMIFRKSGKRVGIGVEPNGNEPTSIFGKTLVRCFELFDVKGQSQSGRPDWRRYAENAVKVKMYT